nr:protein ENL-like [Aegilops tauschii subsp. strangulata]
MPDCNAEGVASTWQLPTLDEELHWSSTLVERAARTETGMYKHTSSTEVAYILKRVEEDKAARLTEMEKAAKARKGKGKAEDMSSSHGSSEAQTTEGDAGEELAGDNFAGLEALAAAATELQEEENAGEAAVLDEEWLAAGPQSPEPDPEQRTRRRTATRGAAASNPTPTAKRVKKTTTKATKADMACRQYLLLAQTKASSAKRPVGVEAESSPRSSSSSSQSSSSPELPAPREVEEDTENLVHPPQIKEPELLEVVADIGRAAADEATEIAAAKGQDLAAGDAQSSLAVMEYSPGDVPVEGVVV